MRGLETLSLDWCYDSDPGSLGWSGSHPQLSPPRHPNLHAMTRNCYVHMARIGESEHLQLELTKFPVFSLCLDKIPCVLTKFPNFLCFPDREFFWPFSLFSLCRGYPASMFCERRYFRADKFSCIKPYVTFSCGQIFAHLVPNSI